MNTYDLNNLAIKQNELDDFIKSKLTIGDDEYWTDRVIALNVELNELINEIRHFKFWSNKGPSDKTIILDEFVDCIHFALSLGNTLEAKDLIFTMGDMKRPLSPIYFDITNKLIELSTNKDVKLFKSLLNNILEIAWHMGYDMDDVQEAYDIKNKVNYERQNSGY